MEALLRAVNFFASECPDFTIQLLKIFLYIASHNGCRVDQIARGTRIQGPNVTNTIKWLSNESYKSHEPLGWVVKREDPVDHRARNIFLTRKGELIADNLKAQLYPEV